jgi:hypothetical protein
MAGKGDEPDKRTLRDLYQVIGGARTAKVRYGRATLTVLRSDAVFLTPVAEALAGHDGGELSAEDVAAIFLAQREVEHSPTFDWDRVDLARLLPRVTAVSERPEIEATNPEELVLELKALEEREQLRFERTAKAAKEALPGISRITLMMVDRNRETIRQATRPAFLDPDKAVNTRYLKAMEALSQSVGKQIQAATRPISGQLLERLRPQLTLKDLNLTLHGYEGLLDLGRFDSLGQIGLADGALDLRESWQPFFRELAAAARGADSPDIAEAVEASAEEAVKEPGDLDLAGLVQMLNDLVAEQRRMADAEERLAGEQRKTNERLEKLESAGSLRRQILIGIAINVIWTLIVLILATRLHVYLPTPPEESK